jgi:peroxiredoxin
VGDRADVHTLPRGLPVPVDDGAAEHLRGAAVPPIRLPSTRGGAVDLAALTAAPTVLFFYPRTGERGVPAGPDWDLIPGARGCTPQSCGFRDLHAEFAALGVRVAGVSTQTTSYQREFVERNHVPFDLLSDAALRLTRALRLPTFEFPVASGGPTTLIKRMAWYADGGLIEHVWYPVFPPDKNAETVLAWLRSRRT